LPDGGCLVRTVYVTVRVPLPGWFGSRVRPANDRRQSVFIWARMTMLAVLAVPTLQLARSAHGSWPLAKPARNPASHSTIAASIRAATLAAHFGYVHAAASDSASARDLFFGG